MDKYKLIQIPIPEELDYALSLHLLALKKDGTKTTKAELVIKLMRIGLIKESAKLIKEGRSL
jgi:hypothetical protein